MTPLEQRYRRLLGRLPASYRRKWEDDMVATYLATTVPDDPEEAEYVEQCGRPSREERLSIWRLAVRLRLGGVGDPPHAQLWGDAIRRVALAGLLANAAGPITGLWAAAWLTGRLPWPPIPADIRELTTGPPFAGWQIIAEVGALLWVVAFIAAVLGQRRVAVVTGCIAFVTGLRSLLVVLTFALDGGYPGFLISHLAYTFATLLPVVALAAFHSQSPPVPRRSWLRALAATAVLATGLTYLTFRPSVHLVDRPALLTVAVGAAAIVHLARRTTERDPAWTLALALMAGVVLALRVLTTLDMVITMGGTYEGMQLGLGVAQALVLAVLTAVLWARAARALRDLPVPDDHTPPPILTA